MDRRILDLVSTKYVQQKLALEIDLEKLINDPHKGYDADYITNMIMQKVQALKTVADNLQAWENIVSQLTPKVVTNPEPAQ